MAGDATYLCTVDDIAGPGEDVQERLTFFARILDKLGYSLISDKEHFHLWAARPGDLLAAVGPAKVWSGLLDPDEFERRLLAWIHINAGILPDRDLAQQGAWTFLFSGLPVMFSIKDGHPMKWSLTIEETEPCPFTGAVARYFAPPRVIPTHLAGGRIRTIYFAGDLIREFDDQTDHT